MCFLTNFIMCYAIVTTVSSNNYGDSFTCSSLRFNFFIECHLHSLTRTWLLVLKGYLSLIVLPRWKLCFFHHFLAHPTTVGTTPVGLTPFVDQFHCFFFLSFIFSLFTPLSAFLFRVLTEYRLISSTRGVFVQDALNTMLLVSEINVFLSIIFIR